LDYKVCKDLLGSKVLKVPLEVVFKDLKEMLVLTVCKVLKVM